MTRFAVPLSLACVLVALAGFLGAGCARELPGRPPPIDRPNYPTGIALHPEANVLAVVSSNFDLGYAQGAVLLADLDRVDDALAEAPEPTSLSATVPDAYVEAALIPSFGNKPVFSSEGQHLLVATRADNLLVEIEVTSDAPLALACGDPPPEGEVPTCGVEPRALVTPGNDPFQVALTAEQTDRLSGITTSLLSNQVVFFTLQPAVTGADRLQQTAVLTLGDWLDTGEVIGVRGLALRAPADGIPLTAFAVIERTTIDEFGLATDLIWFDATRGDRAEVRVLPLTEVAGSLSARSLALTPDGDALLVVMRDPDGLARIDLNAANGLLSPSVSGVVSTCAEPVTVATARIPLAEGATRDRAFVTCFAGDAVLGYNPLTLDVTDAARFFGRGPYDLALDVNHAPPRAYVSFFLDDSIGVFDLVADGSTALIPRGRIGVPRPPPEGGAP